MPDPLKATHALPVLRELPDELYRAIGRVVFEHSILESLLLSFSYHLAGVDDVTGRLAVKSGRSPEQWTLILDLAEQRGVKVHPKVNAKDLRKDLEGLKDRRDALAHGLFLDDPYQDAIMLREIGGTWQPPGLTEGSVKRKINPPARLVNAEAVNHVADVIAAMTSLLKDVWGDVAAQLEEQERIPGK